MDIFPGSSSTASLVLSRKRKRIIIAVGAVPGGLFGSLIGLAKGESFDLGRIFFATGGAILPLILSLLAKKPLPPRRLARRAPPCADPVIAIPESA